MNHPKSNHGIFFRKYPTCNKYNYLLDDKFISILMQYFGHFNITEENHNKEVRQIFFHLEIRTNAKF